MMEACELLLQHSVLCLMEINWEEHSNSEILPDLFIVSFNKYSQTS